MALADIFSVATSYTLMLSRVHSDSQQVASIDAPAAEDKGMDWLTYSVQETHTFFCGTGTHQCLRLQGDSQQVAGAGAPAAGRDS